ncbi:hypothetical protein M3197_12050 [Sporosarcina aquimarina]|uniref:hypothetical protein n=1 Tax=Sporosarcina aquimarina TaxID=114975 RepID=UPI00203C0C1C|nr:hypothetical protein [Sporosarcina aquimarina]MCM3758197.1 hypothetical protein [Sporosarcina aquimarina]
MDQRIETVLEELKVMLGLKQFVLHTHSLSQEVSAFGGFDILLTADWLPPATEAPLDDDILPEGTVSTRYSLRFQQLRLAITQGEKSFADPIASSEEAFLKWSHQHTGLRAGNDFVLTNRTGNGIEGLVVHNDVPVQTDGFLELEWDESGRIIHCMLPLLASNDFDEVFFSMTLEAIEPLVRQQLTAIRLPIEDEERFADYYAIDEVFIAQDGTVLPYFSEEQSAYFPRIVLRWESVSTYQYERIRIQPFSCELSSEEAFSILSNPGNVLSDDAVKHCLQSATKFLSSQIPEESGEWEAYRIMQQPGNIEVVCRKLGEIAGPLRRKLLIMLNKDTYEVMNFMDSSEMAQLFEGFTQPRVETVSQEEAFEKMVTYITLEPKYVYHQYAGTYKLCGLLDSEECIDAVTGELKQLNEL